MKMKEDASYPPRGAHPPFGKGLFERLYVHYE